MGFQVETAGPWYGLLTLGFFYTYCIPVRVSGLGSWDLINRFMIGITRVTMYGL